MNLETATNHPTARCPEHLSYVLRIADGSLILAQGLSEWCGHGPVLEEDIAFANIALDLLGQARLLYTHAGELEGAGRDEDRFAYWRDEQQFLNPTLAELPNGDFAHSVLRAFFYTAYQRELWIALATSKDLVLARIAGKSLHESRYHVEHLGTWVTRLGDGTDDSHGRMQRALHHLWPYTNELFVADRVEHAASAHEIGPDPESLRSQWQQAVATVLTAATLALPGESPFLSTGKQGLHLETFGKLLAEMQSLARAHPDARW
ncbi:MAG: phenylacetate-CoA oxygenase subunit PaaI [Gammaproteobacteria bacterium]|nr:phenylacetate-CoA oxygenase subunit PaaI [Gammaproteobacteria bacterium]